MKVALRLGRGLANTIADLKPKLRCWMGYFKLTEARTPLEEIDGSTAGSGRRRRRLLWRQAKRVHARARMLMRRQSQGRVSLSDTHQRLLLINRTAVCATARTVV